MEVDGGDVLVFSFFSILDVGRMEGWLGLRQSFEAYFLMNT